MQNFLVLPPHPLFSVHETNEIAELWPSGSDPIHRSAISFDTKQKHNPQIQPQSHPVMKPYIPYSILAAALACGMAQAVTSYTTPVGYETLELTTGFNFDSVRLHTTPIAAGTLESATASPNTVTDSNLDLGALITSGTYILEILDGSGIIQEITTAGPGTSIVTAADLTGLTFPCSYSLRPAATLQSVFGSTFTASPDFGATNGTLASGLTIGYAGATGADQIWFWNGTDFTEYFFDEFTEASGFATPGWTNLDSVLATVNASAINLIYADSFIISSASGNNVVISGELKTTATELNLVSGFNFVGSVAPVGATLETAFGTSFTASPDFGATNGTLDSGLSIGYAGATGADQVWIWNGTDFTEYFFDEFTEASGFATAGWTNLDAVLTPVNATTTNLPPGYIITAAGAKDVVQGVPSYYSGL